MGGSKAPSEDHVDHRPLGGESGLSRDGEVGDVEEAV